jgi:cellulose synthase/poly-beta-1,6-N-acetylglucosamine synthase-like glycosyltransferase
MLHIAELALTLLFVAATLPLLLELALACAGNLLPRRLPAPAAFPGRIAVLVPAHNEELLIARTVESLLRSLAADSAHDSEIVVIAHNCSDRTARRARAAGARVLELNGEPGKGRALRFSITRVLIEGASAVAVIDADTVVSPNFLSVMRRALARAGAAQCRYELDVSPGGSASPAAELGALAFRGMNFIRPRGRSRLGLSSGIFGNGFALRSETLATVPWEAFGIAEDLEYHTRLELAGIRTVFVEEATVFGAPASGRDAERSQRLRWEGGRLAVARQYAPRVLASLLRGHLRSLHTLADLFSLPLGLAALLLLPGCALGFAPHMHVLLLYSLAGIALIILYVLLAVGTAPQPRRALAALVATPAFLLRKTGMVHAILRASRRGTAWTRTGRGPQKVRG